MAISFRAPKPKPIPQAPMGPPTPHNMNAADAVLRTPGPAAPAGPAPPSPSSLSPKYFSPPGNEVQGPPVPPGYLQSRAALTPQTPPSPFAGSSQGTLPFNAPHPVPQTPPATPPSRPLGSTFGNPGANIQNILSGVTPSRAGVATGASQALAPQPPPTGMAPMGGGMQLPPGPQPQHPYQGADDPGFLAQQGALGPPGSTRGPVGPNPFDPSPLVMRGQWNQPGAFDQVAPGPQPNGTTTMPFPNSVTRTPTNQAFPTSPVVPPQYANPFPFPTGPLPSGPNAVKAQTAAAGSGAPGPALPPKPPTAPAQYTDAIKSGGLMNNKQAADFQKQTGYQPNKTVGGAYGQPSPIRDPRSADTQKQIKDAQNVARFGNGREAELARLNNQGFKAPPVKQHDFGLTNSGKFKEGGQRIEPYSESEKQKMADATAKLNSPERKAYLDKRAEQVAARKEKAAGRIQEKAIARQQTRAFNQGRLDNNTRFAFMNPKESSARDVGLANADAIKGNNSAKMALEEKRINATREVGMDRNDAIRQQGRDRISADALANGRPDPFAPKQEAGPAREPSPQDIKLMPKADGYATLKEKHGAAEANRMMNEIHGTQDWNYEKYPNGPTLGAELFGSDNRVPSGSSAPQPAAPVLGTPSRARMGGGMQLPPTGKKSQKPNPYEQNIAGRWGGYMN